MEFKLFLLHQKEEMERYKWCRGIELGRDPGEAACREWVEKHASHYRSEYERIYNQVIKETSSQCRDNLKQKVPGVSDELWGIIFEEIIDTFTKVWLKDMGTCQNDEEKKHLEEI